MTRILRHGNGHNIIYSHCPECGTKAVAGHTYLDSSQPPGQNGTIAVFICPECGCKWEMEKS